MKVSREHRRFFVESLAGEVVELSAEEVHHAADVLRLTGGSEVEVFDGAGGVAVGTLRIHGRKRAEVHVLRRREAIERPEPVVQLAFACPKGKRLDWLLEKATELGAARLMPVIFERSVAIPSPNERARRRWRRACIAAAKQCRADFLPQIAATATLADFLSNVEADIRILGDAEGNTSIPEAMKQWSPGKSVAILIGPEGGLADAEIAAAGGAGFSNVRLGNLTLRVETAAVALLAGVNACCQDM